MTNTSGSGRSPSFPSWPVFDSAERENLLAVLESGVWSDPAGGRFVSQLETDFAAMHHTADAVAVTNGSIALMLALRALGIGAGDEVIVPSYTFIATATAVLEVNALPVIVDIDPGTFCIDPGAVEAAITPRTKAIIPVHLGGHPADMDRLVEIATRHGLALIEDAAHAHGSTWRDKPVGGWGQYGCFSMQASKNITGGEGGMVTTNDPALAARIRSLRNCGRVDGGAWYEHHLMGGNYRLTEFQAAVLCAQVDRYPDQIDRRDTNGRYLDAGLAEIDGIAPQVRDPRATRHAQHLYSFRYDAAAFDGMTREAFCARLKEQGIPAGPGYAIPLDRQPLFTNTAFDRVATGYDPGYAPTAYGGLDLPDCRVICDEVVWLPQNVLLGDEREMEQVVAAVQQVRHEVDRHGSTPER